MKTFTENIIDKFGREFFNNRRIHDIGCHNFKETQKFLDLGADIIGLDRCIYTDTPKGIRFIKKDFLDWEPEGEVDILHMANVVLFIENDKVMQKIADLNPKMIMIQTMYDYPEPNWPPEVLKKLYFTRSEDWTEFFEEKGYKTIDAKSYEKDQDDLGDNLRKFHFTEYIGERIDSNA